MSPIYQYLTAAIKIPSFGSASHHRPSQLHSKKPVPKKQRAPINDLVDGHDKKFEKLNDEEDDNEAKTNYNSTRRKSRLGTSQYLPEKKTVSEEEKSKIMNQGELRWINKKLNKVPIH